MSIRFSRYLLLLLSILFGLSASIAYANDPIIRTRDDDSEMKEAKAKARTNILHFWQKLENPASNEERFVLKVEMPYSSKDTEHIWVKDIERKNGMIRGTVGNDPKYVKYVKYGQRVEFEDSQISDWMYRRDGKIVGNYSLRTLLPRMPPADAARYRAILAEP